MSIKFTIKNIIVLPLLLSFAFSMTSYGSASATDNEIISNDLIENSKSQYTVTGPDPYIIFNPQQLESNARTLFLDLGKDIENKPLELFFNSDDDVFNPGYKISFTVDNFPIGLVIPQEVTLSSRTRLRLDVNQCSGCTINFDSIPILKSGQAYATLVQPQAVQNGAHELTANQSIIDGQWRLNSLNGSYQNFEVSGADPYLVTPILNISTHMLEAVYFKIKAPTSNEPWGNYQLFYQTEQHRFTSQANSSIRLANNNNDIVEFIIPLDFLSKEAPSVSILERLRLDIPEAEGKWSILELKLIHKDSIDQVKHLIPSLIIHNKKQKAKGLALVKKITRNITSDISFAISYILLLLLTFLFFRRAYRLNS